MENSILINLLHSQKNFTLQPTDYIIGETSGDPGLCLVWPMAVDPSPDGIDWQFGIDFCVVLNGKLCADCRSKIGTPFMRTVYSVFR